jgi:hypothetical protein
MDWTKIISDILWMEEITEKQLSISLTTQITQSALNRLKQGYTKMPYYNLGNELVRRHKKAMHQHQLKSA